MEPKRSLRTIDSYVFWVWFSSVVVGCLLIILDATIILVFLFRFDSDLYMCRAGLTLDASLFTVSLISYGLYSNTFGGFLVGVP